MWLATTTYEAQFYGAHRFIPFIFQICFHYIFIYTYTHLFYVINNLSKKKKDLKRLKWNPGVFHHAQLGFCAYRGKHLRLKKVTTLDMKDILEGPFPIKIFSFTKSLTFLSKAIGQGSWQIRQFARNFNRFRTTFKIMQIYRLVNSF